MKIGILGAGTWGSALARILNNNGHEVTLWYHRQSPFDEKREHKKADLILDLDIKLTNDLMDVTNNKMLLLVVPSFAMRETLQKIKPYYNQQLIVIATKGFERESNLLMSEVVRDELGEMTQVVALSGPSHAEEVIMDYPTTLVSASDDINLAKIVQDTFMSDTLRIYTNEDIKGVELSGALKNVMAIASGISKGLGYGDNTQAALITRGMAEIIRLGIALNCNKETFNGLAGIGDLIVTATSTNSRNYNFGLLIGQGYSKEQALKKVDMVVEGLYALEIASELMEQHQIEMPIVQAVDDIINRDKDGKSTVKSLLLRNKKGE